MLYIIKDQYNRILDKHDGWAGQQKNQLFFRSTHYDEALNKLVELNTRNIEIRGKVIACESQDKNRHPLLPENLEPVPEGIPTSCEENVEKMATEKPEVTAE